MLLSATRNPLYLVLLLLVLNMIFMVWNEPVEGRSVAIISPIKFSLFLVISVTIFNTITSHYGETVFFTIPGNIPLISGPVTLEAVLYGFSNGLLLAGMLTAFTILNVVLPISALIRLVPRAFYPLSIVVSIAITFLPSTRRQIEQVIEAQAIRGHRTRGVGDWLPLFLPLLTGGLERSMQLAETMTARGFAGSQGAFTAQNRFVIIGGLLLAAAGWIGSQASAYHTLGIGLLLGGIALIGLAIWQVGKQMPRASYKNEAWLGRDYLSVGASLALMALWLGGLPQSIKASLTYQPYPQAAFPAFNGWVGALILVLLLPIVFKRENTP